MAKIINSSESTKNEKKFQIDLFKKLGRVVRRLEDDKIQAKENTINSYTYVPTKETNK